MERSGWRLSSPLFWLSFALVVFTACGGGGGGGATAVTGDSVLIERGSQSRVICSDSCQQWGQCGPRLDGGGDVVLAGRGGPSVVSHELIFPANSQVLVDGQESRIVQPAVGGDPINMNFYYVIATDGSNKGGWVAGWCVQAPTN